MGVLGIFKGITGKIDNGMDDEKFINKEFKKYFGKTPDLFSPSTINEKIQWLKINDIASDLYVTLLDKYKVKEYASKKIGGEHVIPLYNVYNDISEYRQEEFLHPYVLKCTHGEDYRYICKDTYNLNISDLKSTINSFMNREYFYVAREWPYKEIKHRIIAEAFMDDGENLEPNDYCVLTMNSEPVYMFIYTEKYRDKKKFDAFDVNGLHIDFTWGYENSTEKVALPKGFDDMLSYAKSLSEGTKLARVDFYQIKNEVYFHAISLYPEHGFKPILPEVYDIKLGEMLKF